MLRSSLSLLLKRHREKCYLPFQECSQELAFSKNRHYIRGETIGQFWEELDQMQLGHVEMKVGSTE